jgi:predicted dehydrogenase
MGTTVQACLNMQMVANKLNGKLVIAHYRRSLPLFLKVKELLANNYIGKVNEVKIIMHKNAAPKKYYENNWRVSKESAGGGLFYDLAPHQIDLVFYFFGEAISYQGKAYNTAGLYDVEDTVLGTMQMQNGIQFKGDWCFTMEQGVEKDEFIIDEEGDWDANSEYNKKLIHYTNLRPLLHKENIKKSNKIFTNQYFFLFFIPKFFAFQKIFKFCYFKIK